MRLTMRLNRIAFTVDISLNLKAVRSAGILTSTWKRFTVMFAGLTTNDMTSCSVGKKGQKWLPALPVERLTTAGAATGLPRYNGWQYD